MANGMDNYVSFPSQILSIPRETSRHLKLDEEELEHPLKSECHRNDKSTTILVIIHLREELAHATYVWNFENELSNRKREQRIYPIGSRGWVLKGLISRGLYIILGAL